MLLALPEPDPTHGTDHAHASKWITATSATEVDAINPHPMYPKPSALWHCNITRSCRIPSIHKNIKKNDALHIPLRKHSALMLGPGLT